MSETSDLDPLQLIDDMTPMREALRGMVAAFVADGFTEEQARALVVRVMCGPQEAAQ